eukprot:4835197-Pyramimonas_sp.AAC.1
MARRNCLGVISCLRCSHPMLCEPRLGAPSALRPAVAWEALGLSKFMSMDIDPETGKVFLRRLRGLQHMRRLAPPIKHCQV